MLLITKNKWHFDFKEIFTSAIDFSDRVLFFICYFDSKAFKYFISSSNLTVLLISILFRNIFQNLKTMNLEMDLKEQLTSNDFNPPSKPIPKASEDEVVFSNEKS